MTFGTKIAIAVRHALTINPLAGTQTILWRLRQLKNELENVDPYCGLRSIASFFNAVSSAQDDLEGKIPQIIADLDHINDGRYGALIEDLGKIRDRLQRAGRATSGWNRTSKGQIVTDSDIYIGGVYGLFTHTVAQWKQWGNDGCKCPSSLDAYDTIDLVAKNFMVLHHGAIIDLIKSVDNFLCRR